MNHLAIYSTKAFGEDYIAMMLSGKKTLDSKFSYRRTAPYRRLKVGDTIYLKESSGPVRGRIRVASVVDVDVQNPDQIMEYLAPRYKDLGIKDEAHLMQVWKTHSSKKYITQWEMDSPQEINYPVRVFKRDMRNWVSDYDVPEELLVAFM